MNRKILLVDDDPGSMAALRNAVGDRYDVKTADSASLGLKSIAWEGPFAVIVSDLHGPQANSLDFLANARESASDTIRIMYLSTNDINKFVDAVNKGLVFRFLVRPASSDTIATAIDAGIEQYRLINSEKELLENTLRGSIRILVEILSATNPELFGRAQRLRSQMRELAEALGASDTWTLELAAMLTDLGSVTVPQSILHKRNRNFPLSVTEQAMIDRIPEVSAHIIANVPRLEGVAHIIRCQRMNFDGSDRRGANSSPDAIPIGSRMLRILIDWRQAESEGISHSATLSLMHRRGSIYDPHILSAVEKMFASKWIGSNLTKSSPIPISLAHLKIGHVLTSNLEGSDGMLLIAQGHTISQTLMEKINNYRHVGRIKEPIYVQRPLETMLRAG